MTLLGQQVAAEIQVVVVLRQKEKRHAAWILGDVQALILLPYSPIHITKDNRRDGNRVMHNSSISCNETTSYTSHHHTVTILQHSTLKSFLSICRNTRAHVCEYLQKVLWHYSFWDLWKTLLEVLQDVVVELSASLRHPEPTQRLSEPKAAVAEIPDLVSSPKGAQMTGKSENIPQTPGEQL